MAVVLTVFQGQCSWRPERGITMIMRRLFHGDTLAVARVKLERRSRYQIQLVVEEVRAQNKRVGRRHKTSITAGDDTSHI